MKIMFLIVSVYHHVIFVNFCDNSAVNRDNYQALECAVIGNQLQSKTVTLLPAFLAGKFDVPITTFQNLAVDPAVDTIAGRGQGLLLCLQANQLIETSMFLIYETV